MKVMEGPMKSVILRSGEAARGRVLSDLEVML